MPGLKAGAATVLALSLTGCHVAPKPAAPVTSRTALTSAAVVEALRRDIDAILAQPVLEHSYWGVSVKSLTSDETLYALNARKLLIPASNMKIVTLAAAAETLGWDFTYDTTLLGLGPITAGTLNGDLVVVGSGDPSIGGGLAERLFADWAGRLANAGIRTIDGRIIGDDNTLDDEALGFGWSWDDLPDDYSAGVSALQFNENAVRVTVGPGPGVGDFAAVDANPSDSGLDIRSVVATGAAGSQTSISTRRLPGRSTLELRGSVAFGAAPSTLSVSVDNPTLFFVKALRTALIAHGIDVRGPAVDIDDLPNPPARSVGVPLISYTSPPLSTLATRLMKGSQNQYAETFLKTLGAAAGMPTAARGRAEAQAILQRWGVQPGDLIQRDGSGLSRYDYVTPDALVTLLSHIDRDARLRGPFEAALPIAGRDGSLSNRMKGTPAEGNARAKTGSMTSVRGLSGYVTTADGEPVAFSILANNFDVPADTITKTTDAIVVRLAQFSRR
jgi:D-alanyl-D-alanine carboxypeptidase/D-alanyl-D-alanine-endopeptidase (penicillin-binding protein 4)